MGRGKTVAQWDEWTDKMRDKHDNGNGHGKSLEIEAQRLLPTPTAQAARHGGTPDVTANGYGYNLWDIPHLLPTPTARDHKDHLGARHAITGKADYLPRAIGELIDDKNV